MKLARPTHIGRRAFTMIELMMVVGLIVIMFTVAIPTFARAHNQRAIKIVSDELMELFHTARAQAIMRGSTMEVHIRPEGLTVVGGGGQSTELVQRVSSTSKDTKRGRFSLEFAADVGIEQLNLNREVYDMDDLAIVRFYSNGTADACVMNVISMQGGKRSFSVDPITGRADYEVLEP